jgi:hypothetical protein
MKKKEFIIPEIHVVLLHMQQHLLAGSGEGVYDTPVSGDTQLSRMDEDFDMEEEDLDIDEDLDY